MPPDKYLSIKQLTEAISKGRDNVRFLITTMPDDDYDPVVIIAIVTEDEEDLPPDNGQRTPEGG